MIRRVQYATLGILIAAAALACAAESALAESAIDGTWSSLGAATPAPSARREYAAVYDRHNARYVIFAGFTNVPGNFLFNEVWAMTLGSTPSWSLLPVAGTPPGGRHSAQWGYDPTRNRVLIFGGYGSHYPGGPFAYLDDVWELSLDGTPTWNELHPVGIPPAGRLAGSAVYDVFRQRFVGFGGTAGLPVDTWELDLAHQPTWHTVQTDGTHPPGSYGMTSIFDAARNRMIIFGGSISDSYYGTRNTTWELSLSPSRPRWRQLSPAGPLPSARRSLTSVYDPLRDRMIIFGGWDGTPGLSAFLGDTWALSLRPGDGAWTQLSPAGLEPGVRDLTGAIYDPGSDRMVVFGGWSGSVMLGDTQFLTWGGTGQTADVTPSGQGDASVAHLEWDTQSTTGPVGGLYRREPGTAWTSIATVVADASGTVLFDDPDVAPGGVYGYKLVLASEVGDEFTGEVWVDIPTTTDVQARDTKFALRPATANPVLGPIGVSLALPGAQPALLEMIDVRGRCVLARDVGTLGAGQHHVELGDARDYAAGVYFLRLSQMGRSVTARVVLVRSR